MCTSQYVDLVTICKRSICISIMYDTVTAIFLDKTIQKVTNMSIQQNLVVEAQKMSFKKSCNVKICMEPLLCVLGL